MPVVGSLKDLSLTSLIQLNCTEMHSAKLSIWHQGREGIISFAGGAIVHAEVGDVVGEDAVYELLCWPDGSFVVEMQVVPSQRTVTSNWKMLLLEGLRRIDERESDLHRISD